MGFKEFFDKYKKYGALILGFIMSIFSVGRFNITLFAVFWPFLILYFIHNEEKKYISIPVVIVAAIIANIIRWIGFVEDVGYSIGWSIYYSIITFLPFVFDALAWGKISKIRSILLYPFSVSAIEFLFSFVQTSNNNKLAYSVFNNLILIQCMSLFGVYFLSFFVALWNSILDYAINVYVTEKKISKWVWSFLVVLVFFEIYGGIYLLIVPEYTTRATIASAPGLSSLEYEAFGAENPEAGYHELEDFEAYMQDKIDKSLPFGTEMFMFAEEAFFIVKEQNQTFIDILSRLATDNGINIVCGVDIYGDDKNMWNALYVVGMDGSLLNYYVKHHPVPMIEDDYKRSRDSLKTFDVPFYEGYYTTKMGAIICYDINFDFFVNWVGFKHPDILLVPSWDWFEVVDYQTNVAKYRAIENGFSIVKNTIAGGTVYVDFCGRVQTFYQPGEQTDDYLVVNGVYLTGRKTLYSFIGIFWNYFYIVGVLIVLFVKSGLFDKKDEKKSDSQTSDKKKLADNSSPNGDKEKLKESENQAIKPEQVEVSDGNNESPKEDEAQN